MKFINSPRRILCAFATAGLTLGAGAVSAATIDSLVGDRDCFGTNTPGCVSASVTQIVNSTLDAGDQDTDQWSLRTMTFNHIFAAPLGTITSAMLTFSTLDMEDNGEGDGLGGAPFDDLLFIDGVEVAGAFDDVFTGPANANTQITPNVVSFNLDSSFFASLSDGTASIVIDAFGGVRGDAISVDYSNLVIEYTPSSVPLPASALLLLSAVTGLGLGRRRFSRKPA